MILDLVRERGPLTVAAFMELSLYDSRVGYYARAAQRSGRAGDFFTSVDVGPLFGQLLAFQIRQMAANMAAGRRRDVDGFDLVEAGAGNGRLSADILQEIAAADQPLYQRLRLHLVEVSEAARDAQTKALGPFAERLVSSGDHLPQTFKGVLVANELLDAMPVHQVVMRERGLQEVYVEVRDGALVLREGPPSTPRLAEYLARAGARLEIGWRVEVNLAAADWIKTAARRLVRGFLIVIDYGHEASELYSATHATGTLTTFSGHQASGGEAASAAWLAHPGLQDITSHVDFSSVRSAAESEGLETMAFLDQTYFLMGILEGAGAMFPKEQAGLLTGKSARQLKTLVMPGGLGSTMKVLLLGKGVGRPSLIGCSSRVRVT